MTIADGMHQIVDSINNARVSRLSDISGLEQAVGQIRYDARKDIRTLNKTRRHDAVLQHRLLKKNARTLMNASQDMLGGFSARRLAMAQESRDDLEEFTTQLKKDVTDIRLDAVHMVHRFADERVHRGIELSRMLSDFQDGIVQDVQQMLDSFKKARIPVEKDLAESCRIWQNRNTGGRGSVGHGKSVSQNPVESETETLPNDVLREKILKIVKKSPKGISLAQVGKKIGIEWRKLVRPAKELLEEGMIRKMDTRYYPE